MAMMFLIVLSLLSSSSFIVSNARVILSFLVSSRIVFSASYPLCSKWPDASNLSSLSTVVDFFDTVGRAGVDVTFATFRGVAFSSVSPPVRSFHWMTDPSVPPADSTYCPHGVN